MWFKSRQSKSEKAAKKSGSAVFSILLSLSAAHFLNDALQMVVPAIYPMLKANYNLSFTQIGMVTLVFQLTASIFQPIVGTITDKKPRPYSLAIGMVFSLAGLLCLAFAGSFTTLLLSVVLVGAGSAVFHPESSRMARYASGGRAGMAQSVFQVGGNTGSAFGPLLAAAIVIPFGQEHVATFAVLAFVAIIILWRVGKWFKEQNLQRDNAIHTGMEHIKEAPRNKIILALSILLVLIFSKFFYLAAMKNYLTFYMISHFGVSVQSSQIYLFVFLFAVAAGTMIGGPLGDKYGRKRVIWFSILGAAPFALLLPYAGLFWSVVLIAVIGVILASAFPAIIVYGQELIPHKLGMVSGLFFGLAFGMGAIGAGVLGVLADKTSVYYMFKIVSYLPLLGICAALLPNIGTNYKEQT